MRDGLRILIATAALWAGCNDLPGLPTDKAVAPPSPPRTPEKDVGKCGSELPPLVHDGCTVAAIACGDVVEGNNTGGTELWDDTFYQRTFCTPQRHRYHESPEVRYRLMVPPDTKAVIRLQSPCADLDLFALSWDGTKGCPTASHSGRIAECEMDTKDGDGEISVQTVGRAQHYLIGVDGKQGATGNYRLHVSCSGSR